MKDQEILQSWQPFFMTFGGAMAALAGLVFVAMSLHPQPILGHPLMRAPSSPEMDSLWELYGRSSC